MRPQVFVTRQLPSPAIDRLAEVCDYQIGVERGVLDRDSLMAGVREADGLVCLLTDAIDREVIEAGTRLRVIANVAVGYNNIDVAAARARGGSAQALQIIHATRPVGCSRIRATGRSADTTATIAISLPSLAM